MTAQMLAGLRGYRRQRQQLNVYKGRFRETTNCRSTCATLVVESNVPSRILVYPPTGTGSFHLTRGDRRRLGPSEFLNDTLIEFALKYKNLVTRPSVLVSNRRAGCGWMNCEQPSRNSRIRSMYSTHSSTRSLTWRSEFDTLCDSLPTYNMFASVTDGYASVRKWTSKFDLFGKKYIVVPINEK
jgi:Ulp1 family protease